MQKYFKLLVIVIGSAIWGYILYSIVGFWLGEKRELLCDHEVKKTHPDLDKVTKRCRQSAEYNIDSGNYNNAVWYYLLSGDYQKNLTDINRSLLTDDNINLGHTYLLVGEFNQTRTSYQNYLFTDRDGYHLVGDFNQADKIIRNDFRILKRLYADKQDQIDEGINIWHDLYDPIAQIDQLAKNYEEQSYEWETEEQVAAIQKIMELSYPYRTYSTIRYGEWIQKLAYLYYMESDYNQTLHYYQTALDHYQNSISDRYQAAEMNYQLGTIYRQINDYNQSINHFEQARQQYFDYYGNDESYDSQYTYKQLGMLYYEVHQYDQSIHAYQQAIKSLIKGLEAEEEAYWDSQTLYQLSESLASVQIEQNLASDANQTIEEYLEQLHRYNENGLSGLAEAYFSLGNNLSYQHPKFVSLQPSRYFLKAMHYYQEMIQENPTMEHQQSMDYAISNIYAEALSETEWDEITQNYLDFVQKQYDGNQSMIAKSYTLVSRLDQYKNPFKSLELAQEAVRLTEERSVERDIIDHAYDNLISILSQYDTNQSNHQEELTHYIQAFDQNYSTHYLSRADHYEYLAIYFRDQNQTEQAIASLQYAIELVETLFNETNQTQSNEVLYKRHALNIELANYYEQEHRESQAIELLNHLIVEEKTLLPTTIDMLSSSYQTVGSLYRDLSQTEEARSILQKGYQELTTVIEQQAKVHQDDNSYAYLELAFSLVTMLNDQEAEKLLVELLHFSQEHFGEYEMNRVYYYLGDLYAKTKVFQKSIAYSLKAAYFDKVDSKNCEWLQDQNYTIYQPLEKTEFLSLCESISQEMNLSQPLLTNP